MFALIFRFFPTTFFNVLGLFSAVVCSLHFSHCCCELMLSSRLCLSQVAFHLLSAVRFCRSWYSLCLVVLVCFCNCFTVD